jgi:hypothetical protein
MPHFALHMLLASRALDAREDRGACPAGPALRNAFLHGAMGPDMGYFPGGEHLLSRAAHVVRSGDLARTLHTTAETPEQRAFARGWLTHMLGDVLIHPIINRAASELLERERTASTLAWHLNAHIRVELGLDALYVARHREIWTMRLRPFFDGRTARWITAACRHVYGVEFEPRAVLRSHHQVVRFQGPLLLLERLIALGRGPAGPFRRLMRRAFLASHWLATWRLGPHSSVAGFLNTVRPSSALVKAVDGVIADFPMAFEAFSPLVMESDISYSLDVGRIDVPGQPTAEEIETRRLLANLRTIQATRAGGAITASA